MKNIPLSVFAFFCCCALKSVAADPAPSEEPAIVGYWTIVDSNGKPESIAVLYPYEDSYFCRILAIYDDDGKKITETVEAPEEKAKGVKGNPPICGLDFIWGLKPDSSNPGHYNGTVLDPDTGNTYTCKVWMDDARKTLAVRGEWLIFGETEHWPAAVVDNVPKAAQVDMKALKPVIPPH